MRAAIAAVLLLALSQAVALAAEPQRSSSCDVRVVVVVSRSVQLSLPTPAADGSTRSPVARSNAPVELSADTGASAVVVASAEAATPSVLYTVVSR